MNNIAKVLHDLKERERDELVVQVEALDALIDPLGRIAQTLNQYNAAATVSEALQALYDKLDDTIIDVGTYRDFIKEDLVNVTKTLSELEQIDW